MSKLAKPKSMRGHDILIKYIQEDRFAEQLKYGGLFMHTPKYYREEGFKNLSVGDPNELDDLYPIWCASIFHNSTDIDYGWELNNDLTQYEVTLKLSHEASIDIIRALYGYQFNDETFFEPLGNYAVVFFDAAEYIGKIVEGFTDAVIYYSEKDDWAVPIECGKVSCGKQLMYHPKLFKADDRFSYQREYRIRLGIKVDEGKFDVPLNLNKRGVFDKVMDSIEIYDKQTILKNYEESGYITFRHIYKDITDWFD